MSASQQNRQQVVDQQQLNNNQQINSQPQITIVLNPAGENSDEFISVQAAAPTGAETYQMQPVPPTATTVSHDSKPQQQAASDYNHHLEDNDHLQQSHHNHQLQQHQQPQDGADHKADEQPLGSPRSQQGSPATRFKWTNEKSQVAMNLVKYGCKPKLVSVAVGCSLRTAQKFAETVTPKMEGESYKAYEIRRRGRKSKDVNHRLNAIREVLSQDCTKTQVEIAADLKVSNTTVCRDLKKIGASWREKKSDKKGIN